MENKPASLFVVFLGKSLNGMPPIFMWQTGNEAKQSTRLGGPVWRKTRKPSMSSYAQIKRILLVTSYYSLDGCLTLGGMTSDSEHCNTHITEKLIKK